MRKVATLSFVLVLLSSSFLWANGKKEEAPMTTNPSEISGELLILNWLTGSEGETFDAIDEAFMAKYPNINIKKTNTSSGGSDARSGIKTSLLAGDQYDLILNTWPSLEAELREQEMLLPIDTFWDQYNLGQYLNASWRELGSADGQTWAMYFLAGNRSGMWYSTETIKEVGITEEPKDWASFLAMCAKLKDGGYMPVAIGAKSWAQTEWFENLLLKVGGTEAAAQLASREIPWTSDVVVETLKKWRELIDAGYVDDANTMFSNHWDTATDAVLRQRKSGVTLMGSWINNRAVGEYGLTTGEDYSFMQFPAIDQAYASTASIDGKSWLMMSGAPNPSAAGLYLDFIAGPEGSAILAQNNFMTPSSAAPLENYDPVSKKAVGLLADSEVFFVLDDMLMPELSAEFRSGLQTFLADPSDASILAITEAWEAKAQSIY
ncbi:MAG: ABC transporter substrate-binding protein [Spirochaetales bacterium]|nr:ABC transporter substrate-binding protein [Spirochaetales bacterium]